VVTQDSNHGNVDNRNNGSHEASRHFRKEQHKEYLQAKID